MSYFLFVHFREKRTPDGEQVHFAVSKDGFNWEAINAGHPVLWSYYGDKGVRDFTITRTADNRFIIMATDLSLAYGMRNQYQHSWQQIKRHGSKDLVLWESDDLLHWSSQRMIHLGNEDYGCRWAPDILYNKQDGEYMVHWSSAHSNNDYTDMSIYYSTTKDFISFSQAQLLYKREDGDVIDSAIYYEDGKYYLFVKSQKDPAGIILLESQSATGPYVEKQEFTESFAHLNSRHFEAPTALRLDNGRWILFLDFFGCEAERQGYVPFIANSLAEGKFVKADQELSFPYGFKHGTVLEITKEEYESIAAHDFSKNVQSSK